jgi:rhamnogalacturonan endolyase
MKRKITAVLLMGCLPLHGEPKRSVVAVPAEKGKVLVSWQLLEKGEKFDVYRWRDGRLELVKEGFAGTSLLEEAGAGAYEVRKHGKKKGRRVEVWDQNFLEIPINPPKGYRAGDCSVGDLDGDGEWELVVHLVGKAHDNSHSGLTTPPILDGYEQDGTRLWRINLGKNIREGEHYTQFMVYDLDGDGCAEVSCKTADGSIDGKGVAIGDASADWVERDERSKRYGRVLAGPEFLTIFDGRNGAALKTVPYLPGRDPIDGWGGRGGNGGNDSYGNRCDRFLACVAYLDGKRPSLVMCRGVYGRTVLVAWDWREGALAQRWVFDSKNGGNEFSGMGGHSLAVADVDQDGRDEIVYQAMVVDDDGAGLFSTGRRHGDTLTVGDLDPDREGLELYLVTENEGKTVAWQTPGAGLHCARTGEVIWSHSPGRDLSNGLVADIDPRFPGCEVWDTRTGLRTIQGEVITKEGPRFQDWLIWWDGDLLREIYGGYRVVKWDWVKGREETVFQAELPFGTGGQRRRQGVGRWPNLSADLIGDWREGVLLLGPGGKSLRLYTTAIPSKHAIPWLMLDRQYRLSVVLQNVVYNKAPQISFFLGQRKTP